jgi:hypothetical protein
MTNIYVNNTGEPLEHIFIFETVFYLASAASSLLGVDDTVANYLIGDQTVGFYNISLFTTKRIDPCFPK